MPKIPRSEATVAFRSADVPFSTGDGYEKPGKALQQLGRGISDLGQGIGSFVGALSPEQDKEDDFNTRLRTLQWWNAIDREDDQHRQSYTGDGEGYAAGREQWFNGRAQELMGGLSAKGQKTAAMYVEQKRSAFGNQARNFEHGTRTQYRLNATDGIIAEQFLDLQKAHEDELEDRVVGTLQGAESIINQIPGVTENQREQLRQRAQQAVFSLIKGRLSDDKAADVLGRIAARAQEFQRQQPAGTQQGGPVAAPVSDIRDFSRGRGGAALPASSVKHIVLHDVSGPDRASGRVPKGGNIPNYHVTFDKDGIYQEVPFDRRAPHATTFNDKSIAIAHIGYEGDKLSPEAVANGAKAVKMVAERFGISPENILRHPELGSAGTRRGSKDPKEASWREDVLAYLKANPDLKPQAVASAELAAPTGADKPDLKSRALTAGMARPTKVSDTPSAAAITPELTAYSPQRKGDAMQGGYAAARPGPDGKAEVRTLADLKAGASDYITVAGDPSERGKTYIIPRIEWIDKNGQRQVSENVKAVVHDTGSAFKGKGNGRFDIPVDKDMPMSALSKQPFSRQKLEFIPQGDGKQRMALGGPAESEAPIRVADGGNRVPGAPVTDSPARIGASVSQDGRIPGNDNGTRVAGSPQYQVAQAPARSSVWSNFIEGYNKVQPALQAARMRAIEGMIGEIEDASGKGYALPQEKLDSAKAAVGSLGSPEMTARHAIAMGNLIQNLELAQTQTPENISRMAQGMRAQMVDANGIPRGTPDQIARVESIEKLAKGMDEALNKDPYAYGARVGLLPAVVPLDPRMKADELKGSLQARMAAADAIKQRYGRQAPIFKPDEVAKFTEVLSNGGEPMIAVLGTMADVLKGDAPRVFDQIAAQGQDGRVLAQVGGLISIGASDRAIKDVAAGLKLRADAKAEGGNKYKAIGASHMDEARQAALSDVGTSYAMRRDEFDRAIETALVIYDQRQFKAGADPKVFDGTKFKEAFREAAGQSIDPRTKITYGGVDGSLWSSHKTALPHWIQKDGLSTVIGLLKQEDITPPPQDQAKVAGTDGTMPVPKGIQFTGPVPGFPHTGDGKPMTLARLKGGYLYSVGPGKYWVATNPITDPDPGWAFDPGAPNGIFVLDLNKHRSKLSERATAAGYKALIKPE